MTPFVQCEKMGYNSGKSQARALWSSTSYPMLDAPIGVRNTYDLDLHQLSIEA